MPKKHWKKLPWISQSFYRFREVSLELGNENNITSQYPQNHWWSAKMTGHAKNGVVG